MKKEWHERIPYAAISLSIAILALFGNFFSYYESTQTSSHETQKIIAVMQEQIKEINNNVSDMKIAQSKMYDYLLGRK